MVVPGKDQANNYNCAKKEQGFFIDQNETLKSLKKQTQNANNKGSSMMIAFWLI